MYFITSTRTLYQLTGLMLITAVVTKERALVDTLEHAAVGKELTLALFMCLAESVLPDEAHTRAWQFLDRGGSNLRRLGNHWFITAPRASLILAAIGHLAVLVHVLAALMLCLLEACKASSAHARALGLGRGGGGGRRGVRLDGLGRGRGGVVAALDAGALAQEARLHLAVCAELRAAAVLGGVGRVLGVAATRALEEDGRMRRLAVERQQAGQQGEDGEDEQLHGGGGAVNSGGWSEMRGGKVVGGRMSNPDCRAFMQLARTQEAQPKSSPPSAVIITRKAERDLQRTREQPTGGSICYSHLCTIPQSCASAREVWHHAGGVPKHKQIAGD